MYLRVSFAARVALAGLVLAVAAPAVAHPALKTATPSANAVVAAPARLQLQFSEKLEPKFTGVELMKADGTLVPVTTTVGGADGKTVLASVKGKLAPGQYMVMWHAVAGDGHRIKGDYNFTVR